MKFDVARKVRVFNARIEFVEFELRGLSISRKTVQIPSDLLGLAKEPKAQKLLHSVDGVLSVAQVGNELRVLCAPGHGDPQVIATALRRDGLQAETSAIEPSLEDVFVAATRRREEASA